MFNNGRETHSHCRQYRARLVRIKYHPKFHVILQEKICIWTEIAHFFLASRPSKWQLEWPVAIKALIRKLSCSANDFRAEMLCVFLL